MWTLCSESQRHFLFVLGKERMWSIGGFSSQKIPPSKQRSLPLRSCQLREDCLLTEKYQVNLGDASQVVPRRLVGVSILRFWAIHSMWWLEDKLLCWGLPWSLLWCRGHTWWCSEICGRDFRAAPSNCQVIMWCWE